MNAPTVYATNGKGFYALTISELNDEIRVRREMIDRMAGTLYPRMIWHEIEMIQSRILEVRSATQ